MCKLSRGWAIARTGLQAAMRKRRGLSSGALGLAGGLLLGLLLALGRRGPGVVGPVTNREPERPGEQDSTAAAAAGQSETDERALPPTEEGGLLLVGVMTARKYLDTRARAVHETWGREVPGLVRFYSSQGSALEGLPLVALARVDDSYPPQKKSFLMLQHMWQRYGRHGRFEWFMRADDDVYVRADRLEQLLRSVDSSKAHYIGQAGRGNSLERGRLSLEYDENFCMGGPGVLLSRETLRRLVPHIKRCLANLYTSHEDVELGRCVRNHAKVSCTWNYEMQSILYHNSSGELAFTGRLDTKEVHRAISMHPVKSPPHMYRLHNYMRGLKVRELQQLRLELEREIESTKRMLGESSAVATPRAEARHHWDFISRSEYSLGETNPRKRVGGALREGLERATREVMASINACSRQRGRWVEERQALYGYRRLGPHGALGVLDLLLMYRKYRGRKLSLPVRRHLYLEQRFVGLELRTAETREADARPLHLVVPVAGRADALRRLLDNFERVGPQQGARLLLVQYPDPEGGGGDEWAYGDGLEARLAALRRTHGPEIARLLRPSGNFSRARAIEQGLRLLGPDDLALFLDVDVSFGGGALARARRNAVAGRRAYFPVLFSRYDPRMVPAARSGDSLDEAAGFWRQFGFGIVAIHKRDYEAIGRFDLGIEGWGKEDVDLYDKAVHSELEVFRAAEPELVHHHHGASCAPQRLSPEQLAMCRGSRADTFAATEQLADLLYREPRYLAFAAAARRRRSSSASAPAAA